MCKTKTGRSFIPGKALSEDIRRGIIDPIVQNGGDHISGFFLEAATLLLQGNLMEANSLQRKCGRNLLTAEKLVLEKGTQHPSKLTGT